MARTQGSKTERMVVVPYRPYRRWLLALGAILVLVSGTVGSYLLGKHHGVLQDGRAGVERDRLEAALAEKTREVESLSQQVANLQLAREVDRTSNEDVRGQVIELKEEIAALEEDIAFYRGLMAPTESRRGLAIGSVDVISTGVPRRYDFKVVMQQLATDHQVLNGSLRVNVVGRQGDTAHTIPLKDLSPAVEREDIQLRFKYFQNVEGELELPEGFEPERIELEARASGGDSVEKRFGWLVQETS